MPARRKQTIEGSHPGWQAGVEAERDGGAVGQAQLKDPEIRSTPISQGDLGEVLE
jgi:hypothetical protein